MAGSVAQVASAKSFLCLFCQRPNAIPVKDVEKFKEHMQNEHNILKGHIVLLAQHFTDARENKEIKERVEEEMFSYLEIIDNGEINKDNLERKVGKIHKCPFCKEASNKTNFLTHLNNVHKIFFGHEMLVASWLLTMKEKEHVINRVKNKATQRENDQKIWASEKFTCNSCGKEFLSSERLALHVKKQTCSDCLKCFTNSASLRRHISLINTRYSKCSKITFKCPSCTKMFRDKQILERHTRTHQTKNNSFLKCSYCKKEFLSKQILESHQKRRKTCQMESVPCTKCHNIFPSEDLLNRHKKEHNCQKLVTCKNCNNPVGELRYSMHLLSCKTLYVSIDLMCKTCFRCFNDIGQFQCHLTKKHIAGGPLSCKLCKKTFATEKWVNKHSLKYHYFEYKCKQCSQLFSTKAILRKHMNIHFDNEAFECSRCLKKYNSKSGLIGHARREHPQQVDDIVEIKKAKEPDEDVKVMIEKSEAGWTCKECGKNEIHRFYIIKHIERKHLGRRSYACSQCNKSYLRKRVLTIHRRSHTGERPYSCQACGWAFSSYSGLAVHKSTHLEVRPFKCTQCDKSFVKFHELSMHVKRKHSNKTTQTLETKVVVIH